MSTLTPPTPRLRRARLGVFGIFFVVGFLMAIWLVNIPAIQERTGVSHAVLGGLILVFGLGSFIGMQITGALIDRVGSRRASLAGVVLMVLAVNLPGMAGDATSLGVALFIFGLGNGATDVAMNHQAVVVERRYGRPIMSAFHAFFSLGGAAGALLGAGTQAAGLDVRWALLGAAVIAAVLALIAGPALLSRGEERADTPTVEPGQAAPAARGATRRRVIALAFLAFVLMLAEGVANDWSALHAVEHLGRSEAQASLAYGTFAITMTVGRFLADRVSFAVGPLNVVRYGSAAGALGLLIVVLSPIFGLTLLGWAVFGLGLSGVIPQIFTAAGNVDPARSGLIISRVVGAGYIGMLAGPAVIGFLGGGIGLTLAFILPLLFCVCGVILAPSVRAPRA
ncbi:MFS transporter [Mycetocola spongiae]|uniref:MFS transporter n=1 Tax=Mycetocola spongiae TaxID=2859226 RepID=UPI001CF168C9|nr:MFS transporter [Mycetocola spongiae]UCR88059.1 MFS transporter [Mycetocola spongiae]